MDAGTYGTTYCENSCRDEDTVLVEALVANEAWAWREFLRRYDPMLHRCIAGVTRRFAAVSPCDVSDIHAQLLLSLLANDRAKLRAFDPSRGSRFSSYLGMLAIHCAYDHLRSVRREPRREELSETNSPVCDDADPYERAVQDERAALAARVLEGFSERDRVFAALYFGEGMEPSEIARSMKISLKTVYSKKHKIQSKLEGIMARLRADRLAS
jgi:RNA polymerase sigma-70 factor (ECF subfamily)